MYRQVKFSVVLVVLLMVTPAMAHSGAALSGGFTAGFLHPLSGLDHLLGSGPIDLIGAI